MALERELPKRHGNNQHTKEEVENFPPPEGKTRDIAAKAAGFGNGKTRPARVFFALFLYNHKSLARIMRLHFSCQLYTLHIVKITRPSFFHGHHLEPV